MPIVKHLNPYDKRALTSTMNNLIKYHVIKKGWNLTDDSLMEMANKIIEELPDITAYALGMEDIQYVDVLMYEYMSILRQRFKLFGQKESTVRQVYYYVDLCIKAGETPRKIWTNYEIAKEIDRLKNQIDFMGELLDETDNGDF